MTPRIDPRYITDIAAALASQHRFEFLGLFKDLELNFKEVSHHPIVRALLCEPQTLRANTDEFSSWLLTFLCAHNEVAGTVLSGEKWSLCFHNAGMLSGESGLQDMFSWAFQALARDHCLAGHYMAPGPISLTEKGKKRAQLLLARKTALYTRPWEGDASKWPELGMGYEFLGLSVENRLHADAVADLLSSAEEAEPLIASLLDWCRAALRAFVKLGFYEFPAKTLEYGLRSLLGEARKEFWVKDVGRALDDLVLEGSLERCKTNGMLYLRVTDELVKYAMRISESVGPLPADAIYAQLVRERFRPLPKSLAAFKKKLARMVAKGELTAVEGGSRGRGKAALYALCDVKKGLSK